MRYVLSVKAAAYAFRRRAYRLALFEQELHLSHLRAEVPVFPPKARIKIVSLVEGDWLAAATARHALGRERTDKQVLVEGLDALFH